MKKNNKIKLISVLSVIFIIVNIIAYVLISNNKEEKIQIALNSHIEKLKTNYEMIEHYQRTAAISAYKSFTDMKKVIDIMSAANGATTKEQKDILRKQLYNTLIKRYNILKTKGVFQCLFVLPNNEAFLRMHKPSKFGDGLTNIRKGYTIVNKTLKPVFGFSQGKIAHGFRNIFPLFNKMSINVSDKNKKYIGAMEVSFSSENMQNDFNTISKLHTHFLVKKSIYAKKIWKRDKVTTKYRQSAENKDYLITMAKYHDTKSCILDGQKNLVNLKSAIDKNIKKGEKFALYQKYKGSVRVISFLPIKNIEKTKTVAWFVSYEKDNYINDTLKFSLIFIIIIAFIILLVFYSMYRVLNQKEMLDIQVKEKTKDLEKHMKIAQDAEKAKSEFLANMSHEIRTPLNAIVGFVDILKENETNKEKLNQLSIIDKSSRSLVTIINEILDFSKLQSGKTEVEKIDFDTFEEFEAIGGLFKGNCSEKNILLNINIAEDTPKYLNSDIQKIIQVIANLISNAIKFSSNGTKIELKIYYNFDTKRLFVSVIDEGIGIPKDKQKDIFNAFSQADNSTTRKYGGTGLGLSISFSFIKLLDGMLELESVEGFGSRFHFSIPMEIGKTIEKIISDDTNKNTTKGTTISKNKKILLVEDNKANQMFMKVILKKMGLKFDIANDGVEAVDMFKNNKYDCILMDENMPNMNGIEATKNILEYEKENNLTHTPIIALTANALKGDRERFLEAGMDEYLTKPLNKKRLSEVLWKFINLKESS